MRHPKALGNWFRGIVDIRSGEGSRTALMFTYYLLVLFAYYILKPVARALFLNNFNVDKLPRLHILMALLGGGPPGFPEPPCMPALRTS